MTSEVTINTALTQQSQTAAASSKLDEDFAQFLNLLTVQLQNQDPLDPMDSTEFTNQIVAFTGVEQQINTNQKLDALVAMQLSNNMSSSLGYVGMDISYISSDLAYEGRPVDIHYALNAEAMESVLRIYDSSGELILEEDVNKGVGNHLFTWDGLDRDGNQVEEGTYEVFVDALSTAAAALNVSTVVSGRVRGVESQNGQTFLLVGERAIAQATVLNANVPAPEPEPEA